LRADVPFFDAIYAEVDRRYPQSLQKLKFNEALRSVLDHLATDLIENTQREIAASGVKTVEDVRRHKKRLAGFSPEVAKHSASLKRFLNANLYSDPAISEDRDRSVAALDSLFQFFMKNPDRMPRFYSELAKKEPRHRVVCDYIAGMTDHYLLRQCQELLATNMDGSY
jgi:dGTPase